MKNKLLYSLVIFSASILIYSCEDFIEVELSGKSITVLAPANNTVSSSYSQLFKWEDLKGAEKYQLQIVKPNFASVAQFVLDTTTASTQFAFNLQPGNYQWRLRAMNNSSMTEYQTFSLTIDSTLDLSSSFVILNANPVDNYYSKLFTNTFSWQAMTNADNYVFQLVSGGSPASTTATTLNYTFTAEGVYQWKVYAQNSYSNSAFSVTRTITIDTAAPDVPTYISPTSDALTANPIVLMWNTSSTANYSHLQISTDSLFLSALADIKDTIIPNTGISVSYNFYSSVVGEKYYWRVQDLDFAGNESQYFYRRRIRRI